ncbi:glycosyltransferase family 61 protein [Heliorestis convoluta]|uniref:Glycosyltransferase family 61 protein n=1 Tax=Heliorestis convoluta TaxID=356322 RepID=A0A5Q2N0H2_9FIRM|nr:glycosyltransferase family 61 protein [Heliorestis convoluta]
MARAFFGDFYHEERFVTASWEEDSQITLRNHCFTMAELERRYPGGWKPDLIFVWSPEFYANPLGLYEATVPLIALVSDWNLGFSSLAAHLACYDHVFMDRKGTDLFRERGFNHVSYAPLYSFNPKEHFLTGTFPRDIDISMVGNINHEVQFERSFWLKRLCNLRKQGIQLKIVSGHYGEDYNEILNRSKIVFNRSIRSEMNLRAYEAPAAGAMLMLEEENSEVSDHYEPFVDYVPYRDDNFEQLIAKYLTHDKERQAIAEQGRQKVMGQSSYSQHFRKIISILKQENRLSGSIRTGREKDREALLRGQIIQCFNASHGALLSMLQELLKERGVAVEEEQESWWLNVHGCYALLANNLLVDDGTEVENVKSAQEEKALESIQRILDCWKKASDREPKYFLPLFNLFKLLMATGSFSIGLQNFTAIYHRCLMTDLQGFEGLNICRQYDDFRVERELISFSKSSELQRHRALTNLYLSELCELKGKAHLAMEETESAMEAFERSLGHRSDNGQARYELAQILFRQGDIDLARVHLERLLQHRPFCFEAVITLCEAYSQLKMYNEAQSLAQDYLHVIEVMPAYCQWESQLQRWVQIEEKDSSILQEEMDLSVPRDYVLTSAWVEQQERRSGAKYVQIEPPHRIKRSKPKTIEGSIHPEYLNLLSIESPATFVAKIPKGRVWGANGTVITPDNHLLGDVSKVFRTTLEDHALFSQQILPELKTISGTVAVLSQAGWWNYYHWMFDILPRLALLRHVGWEPDYYIVNHNVNEFKYQEQTLQIVGIPKEKIISPNDDFYVQADLLLVPSHAGHIDNMPLWTCQFLREHFLPSRQSQQDSAQRRLYISRAKGSSRRLLNESELVQHLRFLNFEVVYLEELTVLEQAKLFASAEAIVASHGAGLTNLVFCQPGTKVFELMSPHYINPVFWGLANQVGLDYYYIFGEGEVPAEMGDPFSTGQYLLDFQVDVNKVQSLLMIGGI